jgi:diadenylate cyclase
MSLSRVLIVSSAPTISRPSPALKHGASSGRPDLHQTAYRTYGGGGMELLDRLTPERFISIRSRDKLGALSELLEAARRTTPGLDAAGARGAVLAREAIVSSWVAPGVAIPHGRLAGLADFVVIFGRSQAGVEYEAADGRPVQIMVMILGRVEEPDRHIAVLAEVARLLRSEQTQQAIIRARNRRDVHQIVHSELSRDARPSRPERRSTAGLTEAMIDHAAALAREVEAAAVMVHVDAVADASVLSALPTDAKVILVARRAASLPEEIRARFPVLEVPLSGLTRSNHISLSVLFALSRGLIGPDARVLSLFGEPGSGRLDTLLVIDAGKEVSGFATAYSSSLLGDVNLEVLERVLQLASELGREGREGRPVGALFVLGDFGRVREWSHQMVVNPFKGYGDEEKSILDPSLAETIKAFSTIDGAFLIRGDGVIEAAGAFLRSGKQATGLKSGYGARHNAAASITEHTQAAAVVLSQSTGQVSLFRGGRLILQLDRGLA